MLFIDSTEYEVRSLLKDNDSGLIVLLDKLKNKLNCENTILKLGSEGVLLHSKLKNKWIDDRLAAMNKIPKDVNGAGDTMLAMSSLALTQNRQFGKLFIYHRLLLVCKLEK